MTSLIRFIWGRQRAIQVRHWTIEIDSRRPVNDNHVSENAEKRFVLGTILSCKRGRPTEEGRAARFAGADRPKTRPLASRQTPSSRRSHPRAHKRRRRTRPLGPFATPIRRRRFFGGSLIGCSG